MEIKIRELCKSYGKKKALQNFDATFENGIYGILGPNGLRYKLKKLSSTSLR